MYRSCIIRQPTRLKYLWSPLPPKKTRLILQEGVGRLRQVRLHYDYAAETSQSRTIIVHGHVHLVLGVFRVSSAFCATAVAQNAEITRKTTSTIKTFLFGHYRYKLQRICSELGPIAFKEQLWHFTNLLEITANLPNLYMQDTWPYHEAWFVCASTILTKAYLTMLYSFFSWLKWMIVLTILE